MTSKSFPVGLGMQLVKDHAVCIEAMLIRHVRRQHLVELLVAEGI